MGHRSAVILFWIALHCASLAWNPLSAIAQSPTDQTFVAITRVYEAEQTDLLQHHRYLFDSGITYGLDLLTGTEVSIYDPATEVITLVNRDKKIQTVINTDDLVKITAGAKAQAQQLQYDVGLNAKIVSDDSRNQVETSFAGAKYVMTLQDPPHRIVARDFNLVSDLALKINLLRRRGLPPFARMALGDHVASLGKLPKETRLETTAGKQTRTMRSTLTIEPLLPKDRKLIAELRGMMSLCRTVPLDEFDR